MDDLYDDGQNWKIVYIAGATAAVIVIIGTILDIVLGSVLGADLTSLPQNATERFVQFNKNPLLGLYYLDMLNVCLNIMMIPVIFAVFAVQRRVNIAVAGLGMIIFFIGNTVFIAGNAALPMFDLALKYRAAADEAQKTLLAAAGEALLARGEHGSIGVFAGFILPVIADIVISIAMLTGRVFTKVNACTGILGNAFLFVYLILITFVPETKSIALLIAMPGGLLSLAWMIMVAVKLFQLGKKEIG